MLLLREGQIFQSCKVTKLVKDKFLIFPRTPSLPDIARDIIKTHAEPTFQLQQLFLSILVQPINNFIYLGKLKMYVWCDV